MSFSAVERFLYCSRRELQRCAEWPVYFNNQSASLVGFLDLKILVFLGLKGSIGRKGLDTWMAVLKADSRASARCLHLGLRLGLRFGSGSASERV